MLLLVKRGDQRSDHQILQSTSGVCVSERERESVCVFVVVYVVVLREGVWRGGERGGPKSRMH